MRASLIAAAITVALGAGSLNAAAADASDTTATKTTHHVRHHRKTTVVVRTAAPAGPNMAAELAMRDQEIADLKASLANVEAKVGELEQRTDAQSDVNVQTAKTVETLQADAPKIDKLSKLVDDTSVSGRIFSDISNIDKQTTKGGVTTKSSGNGDGFDVKRGYLTVAHQFDDIWSASLTTDFNYVSADGETQLFIKNLYLQGKFSDAFVFRAGALPMPWIPFAENYYGYRYVENTLIDRLKFGNSADWGLSANGKIGGDMVDYAAAVVNGGGYKNPTRTDSMDFEGRVGFSPIEHTVIAIGGYSGDLGKETVNAKTPNDASRGDAMIAYANGNNRLGAEYFTASDWTPNAAIPLSKDKAEGYSIWGSYGFTDILSLFGRYDNAKPNKDTDPSLKDKYYNFGLQWDVRKGIKLAAVYKNEDLRDDATDTKTKEFGIFGDIAF